MVTYLGPLCCGREEHCKQISLACVGSARSAWATLGLPLLTACVLSQSTLLRLQVALQGKCLTLALCCMHVPGLSRSGLGSWVLHKGTDRWACVLCPYQVSAAQATRCLASTLSPGGVMCLITSPVPADRFPGCAAGAPSLRCDVCLIWEADLWLQPSWRLSTVQDPRKTWLATGSLLTVW